MEADERLTYDDRVVISDEHLAVDVDELCDQASLQLSVSPQPSEGDVVHPLVVHWQRRGEEKHKNQKSTVRNWDNIRIEDKIRRISALFQLYP